MGQTPLPRRQAVPVKPNRELLVQALEADATSAQNFGGFVSVLLNVFDFISITWCPSIENKCTDCETKFSH